MSATVGIALGVAAGIVVITGIIWFLYRRYAGLGGSLSGIPPERKMLVFTDVGKLPDSAQRAPSRPGSARIPSAPRPATATIANRGTPPASRPATHPGSAGCTSTGRISASAAQPALTLGLEAEPLPSTPGSISSPRGHGRSMLNAMDAPPRVSASGGPAAATAAAGNTAGRDEGRPSSASGRPTAQQLRAGMGGGGGADGERPGLAGNPQPGSAGVPFVASALATGTPTAAAAATTGDGGVRARVLALPPALVPTGSVIMARRGPTVAEPLETERSLNSVAQAASAAAGSGTRSPVEAFGDAGPLAPGSPGPDPSTGGRELSPVTFAGRPPLPGRTTPSGGAGAAALAAAMPYGAAAAPGSPSAVVMGPEGGRRTSRPRPGSGGSAGASGAEGTDAAGVGGGGSSAPVSSTWQRPAGMRTPRQSQGAGRISATGLADDVVVSTVSGVSSQFHSFTQLGDDLPTGATASAVGGAAGSPHRTSQQQRALEAATGAAATSPAAGAVGGGGGSGSGSGGAAPAAFAHQRSRLGGTPQSGGSAPAPVHVTGTAATTARAAGRTSASGVPYGVARRATADLATATDGRGSASSLAGGAAGSGGGRWSMSGGTVVPVTGPPTGAAAAGLMGPSALVGATCGGGGAGETPPQATSPSASQSAWSAAVSLGSKLFGGRGTSWEEGQQSGGLPVSP